MNHHTPLLNHLPGGGRHHLPNGERSRHARKRIFLRWATAIAALSAAAFAACGSPDPEFAPPAVDVDGGGDEAEATTTAPEAGDGGTQQQQDAPSDVVIAFDAPGDDATIAERDAAKIEAGGPCPGSNACDCDNDGHKSKLNACGGMDCDDLDPLRHPNQAYVNEPTTDGNWDCVDPVEKQYTVNLNCATLLGLNCNAAAQGFKTDPACGEEAEYWQCQTKLLVCEAVSLGKRRQGCK